MNAQLPKTDECCGRKPRREKVCTNFSDTEGYFNLKCKRCDKKVSIRVCELDWNEAEHKAVEMWNVALTQEEQR